MTDRAKSLNFWDSKLVAPHHTNWMAYPRVRQHLNTLIGGPAQDVDQSRARAEPQPGPIVFGIPCSTEKTGWRVRRTTPRSS
jgi:hypothetical protein